MIPHRLLAFVTRFASLLLFWLLLLAPEEVSLAAVGVDWAVGALAAVGAALLSLRLLPPAPYAPRPWALLKLVVRFMSQSLLSGFEVALRAFGLGRRVEHGFVRFRTSIASDLERTLFGVLTSQIPGTLTVDSEPGGDMLYHCLNPDPRVARSLATDESLFLAVVGAHTPDNGSERGASGA